MSKKNNLITPDNTLSGISNPFDVKKMLDSITREKHKFLKRIFSSRIKANFMIEILYKVFGKFQNPADLFSLFDINFDGVSMVTGNSEAIEYEICRNIVSIHRSNCVFVSNTLRVTRENDSIYKEKLANQVVNQLRIRRYSAIFYRRTQLIPGDEFQFFPVPYYLFSMTTYAISLIRLDMKFNSFYATIFNKSLSALVLMEGNFLDSCYPLCRGIVELYLKLLVLKSNDNALKEHNDFVDLEVRYNCCGQEFDKQFIEKWYNRLNKHFKSKIDYLHFGWVDNISNYHLLCNGQDYSVYGLLSYLKNIFASEENDQTFDALSQLYKMCHAYTHGNVGNSKYPLLHYFEISLMLYFTVAHSYRMLCEDAGVDEKINDIDVLSLLDECAIELVEQYSKRTTDNFEDYYSYKK
ncbi:MAG: hypothetical protein K2M08_01015 [Anaeroplasmataceae bacterium]|nr:hypothetical protein [Anaeroplasmataceae bacterium]